MAYLYLEDWRGGVDRRRPIHALKPGTLWECSNAHITMGGDIEKRKAFVEKGDFSNNTFGLFEAGDVLYTFGSDSAAAVSTPAGVTYMQLSHPNGLPMTAFVDGDLFSGLMYVIARFADDSVLHFYNGTLVADWNDGIVRAPMGSLSGMATAMAALINASSNYDAVAAGVVVTVTAAALNVPFTASTFSENMGTNPLNSLVYATTTPASPGVAQVGTLTFTGVYEVNDRYGVTLATGTPSVTEYFGNTGKPYGNAACVKTHKRKMYAGAGKILSFSEVNDATDWNSDVDVGAGFLNASTHLGGSQEVLSLNTYQGRLALFSRHAIQLWTMQNDDDLNVPEQFMENTGTRSPRSTLEFGGNDVFYLDDSGIRSLKARDASNNAYVSGVGGAINPLVRQWMREDATQSEIESAVAAVEPEEGRFLMAIGTRIYVYSYFPDTQVAAWSWYEPGFVVSNFATAGGRLYARGGNTLYLYGGDSNDVYDASEVTVQMPFTTAGKPGNFKSISGMDIAASGTWSCALKINPNDLTEPGVQMGSNTGVTFPAASWGGVGHSTHVAPLLTHSAAEYACLSQLALYYQGAEVST